MKTNQIMKREFYDTFIEQRTKDGFFNATSLIRFYNHKNHTSKEIKSFLGNKATKEFIDVLEADLNRYNSTQLKAYTAKRGKYGNTWMHPFLWLDFVMWLDAGFKLQAVKFIYDKLISLRIQTGDEYRSMCKALQNRYLTDYDKKPDSIVFVREANYLNHLVFGTVEGQLRNLATEDQLGLMSRLQKANTKLINRGIPREKRFRKLNQFAEMYL